MKGTTVIYYTSNREREPFAGRIRSRLLAVAGHLPIISVSQKPLDFGENICVGDVGASDANGQRQLFLGVEAAKTECVAVAEADCLYPPEYFKFEPPVAHQCYRYSNVWILWRGRDFRRKAWTEGAQVVGRELFLQQLHKAFRGWPEWSDGDHPHYRPVFRSLRWETFGTLPMVSVKTGQGMRRNTGTVKGEPSRAWLPYWGTTTGLRRELMA